MSMSIMIDGQGPPAGVLGGRPETTQLQAEDNWTNGVDRSPVETTADQLEIEIQAAEAAITPDVIEERRGKPLVIGDLTITPIEKISLSHAEFGGQLLVLGSKRPVAVIADATRDSPARDCSSLRSVIS